MSVCFFHQWSRTEAGEDPLSEPVRPGKVWTSLQSIMKTFVFKSLFPNSVMKTVFPSLTREAFSSRAAAHDRPDAAAFPIVAESWTGRCEISDLRSWVVCLSHSEREPPETLDVPPTGLLLNNITQSSDPCSRTCPLGRPLAWNHGHV